MPPEPLVAHAAALLHDVEDMVLTPGWLHLEASAHSTE